MDAIWLAVIAIALASFALGWNLAIYFIKED